MAKESLPTLFNKYQEELSFTSLKALKKAGVDQRKAILRIAKATHDGYRVVVTVVEASNCLAGYKKGDKLVFNMDGQSIPEESTTGRQCYGLILPLVMNFAYNEALMANGILPTSAYNEHVDCIDPGLGQKGGFGHVKVKVQIKKTKSAKKPRTSARAKESPT